MEVGKYQPMTECFICGSQINAGIDPPVCRQEWTNCLWEWNLMAEYAEMVREYEKLSKNYIRSRS